MAIFSNSMAILYLGVGIFIFIKKDFFDLPEFQRLGIAVLISGYGIYRIVKAVIRYRYPKGDE